MGVAGRAGRGEKDAEGEAVTRSVSMRLYMLGFVGGNLTFALLVNHAPWVGAVWMVVCCAFAEWYARRGR
jgi:hypothetical protein